VLRFPSEWFFQKQNRTLELKTGSFEIESCGIDANGLTLIVLDRENMLENNTKTVSLYTFYREKKSLLREMSGYLQDLSNRDRDCCLRLLEVDSICGEGLNSISTIYPLPPNPELTFDILQRWNR
jgi:hypothetical protein